MTVGAVGFGPAWTMEDSMAASIVRLEQEAEELRATVATWEVERGILVRELERLREMVADERAKDAACAEKCRDKYEADRIGGHDWSNR
jgi:regulator of replication initiation timing